MDAAADVRPCQIFHLSKNDVSPSQLGNAVRFIVESSRDPVESRGRISERGDAGRVCEIAALAGQNLLAWEDSVYRRVVSAFARIHPTCIDAFCASIEDKLNAVQMQEKRALAASPRKGKQLQEPTYEEEQQALARAQRRAEVRLLMNERWVGLFSAALPPHLKSKEAFMEASQAVRTTFERVISVWVNSDGNGADVPLTDKNVECWCRLLRLHADLCRLGSDQTVCHGGS